MERLLGGRTRNERLGDVGLAVALAAVGLGGHLAAIDDAAVEAAPISPPIALLAIGTPIVLWWRRERPFVMAGVLVLLVTFASAIDERGLFSLQIGLVIMVLAHAAGSWSRHRRAGAVTIAVALLLIVAGALGDGNSLLAASALGVALLAFPYAAGLASRQRRRYLEEVEARLATAERDRDERAQRAIEQERARIARELHDVVAHHVSLIGVQAGAARAALDTAPDTTRDALRSIEASSRDAVGEMRRLLHVLRPIDDGGVEAPQPGLDRLPALVDQWRGAGVAVELHDDRGVTAVEQLAPAVSAAAYRIVEEALTNVARHSTAGGAAVAVTAADDWLTLEISDAGPPSGSSLTGSGGRGLAGMVERATLFGGTLEAGPNAAGGFEVRARIPMRP